MGFIFLLIVQIGNLISIYPCLNSRAFGYDSVLVPFAVFKMGVWDKILLGGHPSAACFPVYIAGFGTFLLSGFDFNLGSVDTSVIVTPDFFLVSEFLALGTDLDSRIEFIVD